MRYLSYFSKILLIFTVFMLLPLSSFASTFERRVATGMDDVEEAASGSVYTGSSDLELIYDSYAGQDNQTIGLRFQNILLPPGATITNAYIEFEVDETANIDPCTLLIAGHDISDAPAFTTSIDNVSSRTRTTATIVWSPGDWNTTSAKKQTANISSIVQELVNVGGWSSGNSMVFMIAGTGRRIAEAYEGESSNAALLHVEYTTASTPFIDITPAGALGASSYVGSNAAPGSFLLTNSGTATLDYTITDDVAWVSCSPTSGTLTAGASVMVNVTYNNSALATGTHEGHITITDTSGTSPNSPFEYDVSLLVQAIPTGSSCGDVPIYAENLVNPGILVLMDVSSSMTAQMSIANPAGNPQTPDISSIVQEIVNQGTWADGNSMAFIFKGSGERVAEAYDGSSSSAPLLHVDYDDGGVPGTVDIRVSQSSDDAEENAGTGSMYLNSSDLELIYDGHDQVVGVRYQNVNVPPGATITNAYIEFVIDESNTGVTNLAIYGELTGNAGTFTSTGSNISGRTMTGASVAWNSIPDWGGATTEARYVIGRNVISELVEDQEISWGYGTWAFSGYAGPGCDPAWTTNDPYGGNTDLYTKVRAGIQQRDDAETTALKTTIEATVTTSGTPLGPSLLAAREYFAGNKIDDTGTYYNSTLTCQPKFVIDVTDGLGYACHTSVDIVEAYTNLLADDGISVVAVGFGIDSATQVQKIAEVANARGNATDNLFALHDEIAGVGQPFIAQSGAALKAALETITSSIKAQLFYGAAPAPTTSIDYGTFVITAQFNAADWSGDLIAIAYDPITGALHDCVDISSNPTCDPALIVGDCTCWTASDVLPVAYKDNAWTVSGSLSTPVGTATGPAIPYIDATLPGDNYICKSFGDIIKSTPIIIESPRKYHAFDNYRVYKYGSASSRDPLVYVSANDGALHVLHMTTGAEKYRFYPEAVHGTLNSAGGDPSYDACNAGEYCHRYLVDGSPVVADIFKGTSFVTYSGPDIDDSAWRTMLVNGLGLGGPAYFALDITSGNSIDISDTNPLTATTYLWQFTDTELGQAISDPSIEHVTDSADDANFGGWAVYFGSGYSESSNPVVQESKESYLFGIEAYTMDDLWLDIPVTGSPMNRIKMEEDNSLTYFGQTAEFSIGETVTGSLSGATGVITDNDDDGAAGTIEMDTISGTFLAGEDLTGSSGGVALAEGPLHSAYLNDALSTPLIADINYNSIAETLYTGSLYGRMFRVSNISKEETPTVSVVFDIGNKDRNTPIRASADFAYSTVDDIIWLYFGTGKFEEALDKVNTEQQYFIGMKDDLSAPVTLSTLGDLVGLSAATVTDTSSGDDFRVINGTNANKDPWYISLLTGGIPSERVISKPLVVGGVVFFTTFIPDNDICAGNGEAWLYALDYNTGLPPTEPVFDVNGDLQFDANDVIDDGTGSQIPAGIYIGRGLPTSPVLEDKILFVTTTELPGSGLPINLPKLKAKLKSWRDSL